MPVQVGNKYFLIADKDAPAPKMMCLSNLKISGENAIVETKAAPPNQRAYPALANFNDQWLFYGGGKGADSNYLASVDLYRIENNTWTRAPDMNEARADFSFCVQGETLYAMLGMANGTLINTIECLNARKLINGEQASWCAFNLTSG